MNKSRKSRKSNLVTFTYVGGKVLLAPWIISRMPKHRVYVEPMGGSAAVLLAKPRSHYEVYGDIDGNIVNFLLQVRDNADALEERTKSIPFSRMLFVTWHLEFLQGQQPEDNLERAARWFFMQDAAFRGFFGRGFGTIHTVGSHFSHISSLKSIQKRLERVVIESGDYRKLIALYDRPDAFFYFDPPYLLEDGEGDYYYKYQDRDPFDHQAFHAALTDMTAKWALNYYANPTILEMYKDFNIEIRNLRKQVAVRAGQPLPEVEFALITNYSLEDGSCDPFVSPSPR